MPLNRKVEKREKRREVRNTGLSLASRSGILRNTCLLCLGTHM